jgi:hypothetical protein
MSRPEDLPQDEQRRLAVRLASVVLPLHALTTHAQPEGGLPDVARRIAEGGGFVPLDRARHDLYCVPEMDAEEEPEELAAWFVFGACVAWIYAADAQTTAPHDGLRNVHSRVADLLEMLDEQLGDTQLHDGLLAALAGDDVAGDLETLTERVAAAVGRIAR